MTLYFQARDCRTSGGELFAGAATIQLPKEPGICASASGRASGGGDGWAALPCGALALHRHGVRVRRAQGSLVSPMTVPVLYSSILSTDPDVFERFIYFSRRFMARCVLVRTAFRRSPALSPLDSIDSRLLYSTTFLFVCT